MQKIGELKRASRDSKAFLLSIEKDTAERLYGKSASPEADGFFVRCDPAAPVRHGDKVAVNLDPDGNPSKWHFGVVDTKHPERTKRISVALPSDLKDIGTVSVTFEHDDIYKIVACLVSMPL